MHKIFESVVMVAQKRQKINDNDYQVDGLYYCGSCCTRKERFLNVSGQEKIVPVLCLCENRTIQREEREKLEKEREIRVRQLRHSGMTDPKYKTYTFSQDDGSNSGVRAICTKFVENFEEVRKTKGGIFFFGGVGTGKTFFACCIANALVEKGYAVAITSVPSLIQKMQKMEEAHTVISRLCDKKLVVIDDLGAERSTSYAKELIFSVIDSLVRADTVVLVTSNLSPQEMECSDLANQRIYDRVLYGLCPVHLPVVGCSKRKSGRGRKEEGLLEQLGL